MQSNAEGLKSNPCTHHEARGAGNVRRHSARTVLRTARNKICAPLSCREDSTMHRLAFTVTSLSARPWWFRKESSGSIQSCGNRAGCYNEPSRPVTCCTLPANRLQRCIPLFSSHSAGSAGFASATPGGPLSARASCPPSLSCPVWAGRIAARQVNLTSRARPAPQL
jgi:hypothetical protein